MSIRSLMRTNDNSSRAKAKMVVDELALCPPAVGAGPLGICVTQDKIIQLIYPSEKLSRRKNSCATETTKCSRKAQTLPKKL